jgi:hypothetical protein
MASVLKKPEAGRGKHVSDHKLLARNPADGFVSEDARRLIDQERTVRERQKQSLHLQRESILHQTASQPARRAALEAALAQVNGQLAHLG